MKRFRARAGAMALAAALWLAIPCGAEDDPPPAAEEPAPPPAAEQDSDMLEHIEMLINLDLFKEQDIDMLQNLELFLANS